MDEHISKALATFSSHYEGLRNLLRAADVYSLHVLSNMRNDQVDADLINKIINNKGNSTLIHTWRQYLTEQEYESFKQEGHIQELIHQITMASYTALENYLKNAFIELLSFKINRPSLEKALIKRCSFQSLDKIKHNYNDLLDIHLPSFNPDIDLLEEAWLRGNNCWEVITNLSKVRNQIAHEGKPINHQIFYLVDATSTIEFTHSWVNRFNIYINKYI